MSCQLVHQFQGGSTYRLLSRSKLFPRPRTEGKILAAFGDEATKSVSSDIATKRDAVNNCTGIYQLERVELSNDVKYN